MIIALRHPEIYADKVKGVVEMLEIPIQCASCNTTITFTDDYLLLGLKPHNRPRFVTGYVKERRLTTSFIDRGSAVNILSKATMHEIGITN